MVFLVAERSFAFPKVNSEAHLIPKTALHVSDFNTLLNTCRSEHKVKTIVRVFKSDHGNDRDS